MAYVPCISENCNCRFIDIPGNLNVVQDFKDFELEYIGQFAYDILDFQMCDVNDILELLSELLKNFSCVTQNLIGWLEDLYKRDFNPVDSKTIDFTKTQSWQDGIEITNFTGDVKLSKQANNGLTVRDDGIWAMSSLENGYARVVKTVKVTAPWSRFKLRNGALGDFRLYFAGAGDSELDFQIPLADMDIVDICNTQIMITGSFIAMKSCEVQSATKVGNNYNVNLDVYMLMHRTEGPASPNKNVNIEIQIIGRKKVL